MPVVGVAAIPALIVDRPTASRPLLIAPASILPVGRLSRASTIGPEGAMEIARQFWEGQRDRIRAGADRVSRECGVGNLVVAGIGSSLVARELGGLDLARELGTVSDALPAYAVKEVALRGTGS